MEKQETKKASITCETKRLIYREIIPSDVDALFELDSDPAVHRFLGNTPIKSKEEAQYYINFIRQQYEDNGIGRWAVIEKESGRFIGWCGLKYFREPFNDLVDFYEIGYRFMPAFWGKGYATESATFWLNVGFNTYKTNKIYAMTDPLNANSKKVLQKIGFIQNGQAPYENEAVDWFEITREKWINLTTI